MVTFYTADTKKKQHFSVESSRHKTINVTSALFVLLCRNRSMLRLVDPCVSHWKEPCAALKP